VTADRMAAFFERLGHRVVRTPSSHWYDARRGFLVSFPHHLLISPQPDEMRRLFRGLTAGVRYFAPDGAVGTASYMLTCRNRNYDLGDLSANTRSKVRRGLARCTVSRLTPAWVRQHGRDIDQDTLRRIRVPDPYPWDVYWRAVEQSDCVEIWGALTGTELAAYMVVVLAEGCASIMIARSGSDTLRNYPNNALLFSLVREMLGRPGIDQVLFGMGSFEDYQGVDEFKISMGFVRTSIRQHVVLHPLLRPALSSAIAGRVIDRLAAQRPDSEVWRKLRGLTATVRGHRAVSAPARPEAPIESR